MVTYSNLIQTGILIVGIIGLFIAPIKRSNRPSVPTVGGYFFLKN